MSGSLFLSGAAAAFALTTILWIVSVRRRDASIIDPYWGPGFLLVATVWFRLTPETGPRAVVVLVCVGLWAVRLWAHLTVRAHGNGEDPRYADMREKHGEKFWWVSLFTVFWLQAAILAVLAVPLGYAISGGRAWNAWDALGFALFGGGFLFESVADFQLARFRRSRSTDRKVLDRGLWRYSRHPNYFGECVLWWGLWAVALGAGAPWWTAYAPVGLTVLLLRVSGVTLLESRLVDVKPAYADYIRRTPAFFPWFPDPPESGE